MKNKGKRLFLGTAKVDITPDVPVFLAGFSHREGRSEGIANRLYAKIWFFEEPGRTDGKFLLIQADLIWFGNALVERYKRVISEKYNMMSSAIVFHASHTHSGIQTSDRFSKLLGVYESKSVEDIMDKIVAAIGNAVGSLEEVNIYRGAGKCDISINRRKITDGIVNMAPNEEGLVDDELNVIAFKNSWGNTRGVMFHYCCHPTVTDRNYISSEFCGAAADKIEKLFPEDVTVSFLQGFCGDVRPNLVENGDFYRGDHKDVECYGNILFKEVKSILEGKMDRVIFDKIETRYQRISLHLESIPGYEELKAEVPEEEDYMSEWKKALLARDKIESEVPLDISYVRIGKGLGFLTLSAEVVCEYGIFIKKLSGGGVLPLGYSNGMIGYIPTEKQLREGGYEAETSIYYFGLPSIFKQGVETDLKNAFKEMLGEVG